MAGLNIFFALSFCYILAFCNNQKKVEQVDKADESKVAFVEFLAADNSKIMEVLVEVAEDDYLRAKGLMFREDLPETQGMLFIFNEEKERYFWMKNTPVSLDIIFVDKAFKIIKIHKDTTPYSQSNYGSGLPAKYVVEVRAGFTDRYMINEGLLIKIKDQ